jgi:hypothetical protein
MSDKIKLRIALAYGKSTDDVIKVGVGAAQLGTPEDDIMDWAEEDAIANAGVKITNRAFVTVEVPSTKPFEAIPVEKNNDE